MKKLLTNLSWLFDYWLRETLYGPYRTDQYQEWMWKKWGTRYSERYIKDVYTDHNKPAQ